MRLGEYKTIRCEESIVTPLKEIVGSSSALHLEPFSTLCRPVAMDIHLRTYDSETSRMRMFNGSSQVFRFSQELPLVQHNQPI